MKTIEELNEKIKSDEIIIRLRAAFEKSYTLKTHAFLVGGAVVDILEDRIPKDYDLMITNNYSVLHIIEELIKCELTFVRDTKTATTFLFENEHIVQILKTKMKDFDFTISQCSYNFKSEKIEKLDEISFENKILIPVSYEKINSINSLRRLPKWKSKGYDIDDLTYLSLLNSATINKTNINS